MTPDYAAELLGTAIARADLGARSAREAREALLTLQRAAAPRASIGITTIVSNPFRPDAAKITDAIETLGGLVSRAGGEGDDALDVVKDALDEPDRILPELMGAKAAAEVLGTTAGNLKRWATLPAPLYGPDHPDPRRRVATGNLYDADAIRELARARAAASR